MNTLVNLFDGYESSFVENEHSVNTPDTLNEVKELLEFQLGNVQQGLHYHIKYNQPYDPLGDAFTEMLHAAMYGTRCTGSAGSGWDTLDRGESKYSNRLQSRKCNSCGGKVMFFLDECADCGSFDLDKYPKDSRWGISSKAHLEYSEEMKGYRLTLLEPEVFDSSCRTFILRSWFIKTKDEYLTAYASAQLHSPKSNHINFMPWGRDFYRSSPCLHLQATITIDGVTIDYFDINNTTPEIIPRKFGRMTTEQIMRNKTFGKERGETSRK